MTASSFAFIGSYAEASEPSLYACSYDPKTGGLTMLDQVSGLKNPTFLDVDAQNRIVYAIEEVANADGSRAGVASAFRFDPATGRLSLMIRAPLMEAPCCHLTLDRTRRCLMAASYHGGMVSLSPILPDGRIGEAAQVIRRTGSSIHPAQSQARAHSVTMAPDNRYAAVCDLGADRIAVYALEADKPSLTFVSDVSLTPGSGPRHFTFHPSLPCAYAINELSSTVTVYAYDAETGRLTERQTVPTLPEGFQGENGTADIHISPDGRYVYGSNRGHDSIVVYAVSPVDGTLTALAHTSTQGGHPRSFGLDLEGRYLLAANRDGNNLVTFLRDEATGLLEANGQVLVISKPVCIKFASM